MSAPVTFYSRSTLFATHIGIFLGLYDPSLPSSPFFLQVVRLVELLDEAKERCTATIKERRPDISDAELEQASCAMG
jgi:arginyl-tRNA synthetase